MHNFMSLLMLLKFVLWLEYDSIAAYSYLKSNIFFLIDNFALNGSIA